MKAMKMQYKSASATQIEMEKPKLQQNQVLVKVHLAALDTGTDAVLDQTLMGMFIRTKANKKNGPPLVLGWHYSGEIVEMSE